ncbi:MAG: PDZ domain-containing protein [Polyangia bacterium]
MSTVAQAPVEYVVDLADRNAHLCRVECKLEVDGDASTVALHLPVWTPGSYLVREFARHLQDVSCTDESGNVLPIAKTDKATWTIQRGAAKKLTVRYRVYAHDLTVRAAHLDDSHAFWNGAAMFLYHQEHVGSAHRVRVVAPSDWHVTVGLPEVAPRVFEAKTYDELVDSPFEVGTHEVLSFQAVGKPHRLAIWGHVPMARDKLTTDIPKIIATAAALFDGTVPYDDYTFILLSSPGGYGGLEHRKSSTLLTSPFAFSPRKKYEEFLELVAHEFFHLWNVKRIHPTALGPFDYQREAYTRSLWVMEGITSYYDRLLLVRAGLKKPRAYLKTIADELGKIAEIPGRLRQSLEEASFDAWIKFYRPDENSSNSSISYYLKGGIVAMLLDLAIRTRSEGVRSLDDVMRLLWRRHGARDVGFRDEDVQSLFEEGAGCSLDDLFARHVRGREELDPEKALRAFGLAVSRTHGEDPAPWLGVTTRDSGDSAIVSATMSGGPGEAAGLYAGDELVAIDGFRVESGTLRSRLRDHHVGDTIELTVFRRDQLRTLELELGEKPASTYEIEPAKDATAAEGAAFERWLGAPLSSIQSEDE